MPGSSTLARSTCARCATIKLAPTKDTGNNFNVAQAPARAARSATTLAEPCYQPTWTGATHKGDSPESKDRTEGLRDDLEWGPNCLMERFKFAIDDQPPNLLLSGLLHRSAAVDCGIMPKRIPRHTSIRSFVRLLLPSYTTSGSAARFPVMVRVDMDSSPSVGSCWLSVVMAYWQLSHSRSSIGSTGTTYPPTCSSVSLVLSIAIAPAPARPTIFLPSGERNR